jgi:hypothetical protein
MMAQFFAMGVILEMRTKGFGWQSFDPGMIMRRAWVLRAIPVSED